MRIASRDSLVEIPRYGLAIVFAWAGIDKFVLHQYYTSWFSASGTIMKFLPFHEAGQAVYFVGGTELCVATLLFLGIKARWVLSFVMVFLGLTMFAAGYPSSFPQDMGLMGMAIMVILSQRGSVNERKSKTLKYWPIASFSISAVLFLWGTDYLLNYGRHATWIRYSSPFFSNLPVTNLSHLAIIIGVLQIILAVLLIAGIRFKSWYPFVATGSFLVFGIIALDPPIITIQTVGFIVVSFWLAYWSSVCKRFQHGTISNEPT